MRPRTSNGWLPLTPTNVVTELNVLLPLEPQLAAVKTTAVINSVWSRFTIATNNRSDHESKNNQRVVAIDPNQRCYGTQRVAAVRTTAGCR